ncbi:MAG TPA: formate dehydrogenase accessory protein FdhE [Terriglobia bacterium]|jgi:FdhE protein|nr:formate dehydrogenase accessory protein FdhE [Terriglobia bacterium]
MTKPIHAPSRKWDQRIERARELAGQYPFAAEILTFYSKLAAFQRDFCSRLQSTLGPAAGAQYGQISPELNPRELESLVTQVRPFLAFLQREGTSALAGFAAGFQKGDPRDWAQLLKRFWRREEREGQKSGAKDEGAQPMPPGAGKASSDDDFMRFTALAFLQPFAEYLAGRTDMTVPAVRRPVCPFCGSRPLAGVLRPEGEGAKRSLICSLCRTEWDYLRIACPACEESRDEKMCVYTASQFEQLRVEACETCRTYIKTVDLTKNGRAIPEVDELAAIPLTLWADEHGYAKLGRNIFGS